MNILLSTYEIPGLSGNFLRAKQIAIGLSQNGCKTTLITSSSKRKLFPIKYIFDDSISIIESPGFLPLRFRHGGIDPYDFMWRCILLMTEKADIFHAFNPKINSSIPMLLIGKIKKIPVYFDWADLWGEGGIREAKKQYSLSNISSLLETLLEKELPKHVTAVTCISKNMVKACTTNKIKSIYLPVGLAPDIAPTQKKYAYQKIKILEKQSSTVGFIYTDSPDQKFLCEIIKESYSINKNVQFLLMGPPIHSLTQSENVLFNDFVERNEIAHYLAICDFCILPFQDKKINKYRYPNKIGDYLASQKPFLSNPTGDIKELIQTYNIGWLTDENPKQFAKKISLISKDKPAIKMATDNIKKNKHLFTWKKITATLKENYLHELNLRKTKFKSV